MKSMTGYGRARMTISDREITVEIRSVNHRYLDVTVKAPRSYGFLDEAAKSAIGKWIARGKVDIYISIDASAAGDETIVLNKRILENYLDLLHEIRDTYSLTDDISVMSLAKLPDVFTAEKKKTRTETAMQNKILSSHSSGARFSRSMRFFISVYGPKKIVYSIALPLLGESSRESTETAIQLIMPVFQPHRTSTTAPTTPASAAHPRRPSGSMEAASRNSRASAESTPPAASVLLFRFVAT